MVNSPLESNAIKCVSLVRLSTDLGEIFDIRIFASVRLGFPCKYKYIITYCYIYIIKHLMLSYTTQAQKTMRYKMCMKTRRTDAFHYATPPPTPDKGEFVIFVIGR